MSRGLSLNFYTVTDTDGRKYMALGPYRWADAERAFGVRRSQLERGAESGLPPWRNRDAAARNGGAP